MTARLRSPFATVRETLVHLWADRIFRILLLTILAGLFLAEFISSPAGTLTAVRNVAVTLLVLNIAVIIHEFSHLLMARLVGVAVDEFGVAFGKTLVSRRWAGITWKINAIPAGGYIKVRGEAKDEGPGSLVRTSWWRRALIWYAGPLSNFAFAFGLLMILTMGASGNDLGRAWWGAGEIIRLIAGGTASATVNGFSAMGSDPLALPFMGVAGMAGSMGSILDGGLTMIILLTALVSASVGVVNILPIPPLDGGNAILSSLKSALGRRYPERAARLLTLGSMTVLIGFMVVVNAVDIIRELTGHHPLHP